MATFANEFGIGDGLHNVYWNHKLKLQWMVLLFMGCMYLYASRMTMPITVTQISTQLDWKKTTAGTVLSCFFWGYALTQVLGGYLGDRYGGAKVMLGAALGWSLLTFYTPEFTRTNIWALLLSRILLGAFQGLHFPAMSSVIVKYLRQQDRTFFTSVVAAGPSCGLLLMGSMGSLVMVYYGWPTVFKLTGDSPKSTGKHVTTLSVPWFGYFKSPAFWVILLAHFTENNSYFFLISWLPTYFHDRFPGAKIWVFNMVPWIITPICSVGGGIFADNLIRKGHAVSKVRKILELLCQLSKVVLLPLVPNSDFGTALFCVTLAVASSGFHNSGVFINPQDIAPLHAGSVFGLMNTIGAVPGFIGVYLAGYIVEVTKSWNLVFYLTAVLNLIGCLFFVSFGKGTPIAT
ncbi:voltage-gated purine nucleotide uniporter SLC17A9-like isoform X2 [Ornithodoros turicata]|uniref:voltage-gated purine nucleotide uniporter SLC17A9-like isoform X2 n=1 Tax=Ornithodoros turicata TaxID=34597 RepID=UPI003138AC54